VGLTLSDAFDLYRLEYIQDTNQARKTEENHIYALKSLVSFLGDIELSSLTRTMVREWKADLEVKNRAPNTIRGYVIKLRVVLKYLRMEGHDCLDPEKIPVPKRTSGSIDFVPPEDVMRLIAACDVVRSKHINRARNKAIVALLFSSGLRVSELCRLDRAHVRSNSFSIQVKGGDNAVFFIDQTARKYITAYLRRRRDGNPALFVADQGGKPRVTPGNVQTMFRYLRKHTGLNVRPHVMRHSFATDLMKNGADIRYVQSMMHHKNIQTTAQYLHVIDAELQGLHEKFHTSL
jgi:integrase/recombinase XerD